MNIDLWPITPSCHTEASNLIKLHHLNKSRSKRIIWILEELGIEYQLIPYQRDSVTRLAPPALKAINPLAKAPVIEDGDLVLSESGAIVDYPLITRYLLGVDDSQGCFLGEFARKQMTQVLTYVNDELANKDYLLGKQFTGADVLNSFVFEKISESRGLSDYPHVESYLKRILARPAAQKADLLEREHDQEES